MFNQSLIRSDPLFEKWNINVFLISQNASLNECWKDQVNWSFRKEDEIKREFGNPLPNTCYACSFVVWSRRVSYRNQVITLGIQGLLAWCFL